MRALKSIVRWFFALQAAILLLMSSTAIFGSIKNLVRVRSSHLTPAHAYTASSGLLGYGLPVALFAVGALFATAWWTIRKPGCQRSIWAIAASVINVAEGILLLCASHFASVFRVRIPPADGLWPVVLGGAGIFLFSRPGTVPDSSISDVKRAPVAGDRTSPLTRHAATALSFIAQIVAIVIWSRWAYLHHLFRTHGITWLLLIALASLITTIIHECGHALIAWCFQMGLMSFKAGPFQWKKQDGVWRFKFSAAGLLTPGGAVGAVPTDLAQPRWEEILVIAAGPLANLLLGVPAIYAVLHDSWAHYQQTWEFVAFAGSFCLIGAVLNLFPFMSEDGAYSDGARLLQILTKSPLDEYHRTMAGIASTVITSRRYRDLDIAAIEHAASIFPNEFRGLHLHLCASHFFEDSNRLPEAAAALATAEAIYNNFSIDLPGPLHTVFVIGHAYLNRDAAAARLWWDRLETKESQRSNVDYRLAKAALKWIEGNSKEADEAWREADTQAAMLPQFGAYEFDRFRCALLRRAFDEPANLRNVAPASISEPSRDAAPVPATMPAVSSILSAKAAPAAARSVEISSTDVTAISQALARILSPSTMASSAEAATPDVAAVPEVATQLASPAGATPMIEAATSQAAGIPEPLTQLDPSTVAIHSFEAVTPESTGLLDSPDRISPASAAFSLRDLVDPISPFPITAAIVPSDPPVSSSDLNGTAASFIPIAITPPDVTSSAPIPWTVASASAQGAVRAMFTPTPVDVARTVFTPTPAPTPPKGRTVPPAFARRPRTVGPPLSDPFAFPANEELSAIPPQTELVPGSAPLVPDSTPPAEAASVAPTPVALAPAGAIASAPLPAPQTPAAVVDNGRFDPLAFIRAAAIENIST